jgi:hypothetical protein
MTILIDMDKPRLSIKLTTADYIIEIIGIIYLIVIRGLTPTTAPF